MSVQTIIHNSRENIIDSALRNTIDNANKFLLKKKFKLGDGYCEKNQFHNSIINDIMQVNTCELVNHICDVIENGPKECKN